MKEINLVLDPDKYPKITAKYDDKELIDTLCDICEEKDLEITEENLYAMADSLEKEL